ncbi:MAG: META domain-containing protein [Gemmatimonadota bacterium]|nr:META domain-containing protein [Gemmatimonadota bacterium]
MFHLRAAGIGPLLLSTVLAGGTAACSHSTSGAAPKAAPLEDTRWVLAEVGGRRAGQGMDAQPVMLQLDQSLMRATGYAGVNRFSGTYELGGTSLRFGPLATTRRAGPPEAEALEASVLTALGATTGWKITGASLELLDATGARLMRFDASGDPR